jgi:YedE family putative selenium metabolism protein
MGEDSTVDKKAVILAGIVVGLVGAGLAWLGNPPNMGLCVVCFTRDTAGALGLHRVATVQYLRPEIMGFVLGSCLAAASRREWRARGGSSPVLRFFLGMAVAIGALIFLGCPLRMVLRLAGGDLTALYGFAGFAAGVYVGVLYLRAGYSMGRSQPQPRVNRYLAPLFALALLLLLVTRPSFVFFSAKGPGSLHVAVPVGLVAGMVVGAAAQRTRLCMMGGIRDAILLRDFHLLSGFAALFVAALVANVALGRFHPGWPTSRLPMPMVSSTSWAWLAPVWDPYCWVGVRCGSSCWRVKGIRMRWPRCWGFCWALPYPTTLAWRRALRGFLRPAK